VDGLVDRRRAAAALVGLVHTLDVAPGAEPFAGPGQHQDLHRRVELGPGQLVGEGRRHGPAHGVAGLGAIERQGQNAGVEVGEQILGSGVDGGHGAVSFLAGGSGGDAAARTGDTQRSVSGPRPVFVNVGSAQGLGCVKLDPRKSE